MKLKRLLLGGLALGGGVVGAMDMWYGDLSIVRRSDGAPDTYWMATCKEKWVKREKLVGDVKGKVVVVGGGLAGLHTALSLAERGVEVVVLESSSIGWGASGMSKGLAVAGLQVDAEDIEEYVGDADSSRIQNLTLVARTRLRKLIDKYAIKCDVVDSGSLHVSILPPPSEPDVELDAEQVQAITGSSLYEWGDLDKGCFGVNPLGLTRGLARACEEKNVTIYENSEVKCVRSDNKGWTVETTEGEVACEHVVLCGADHLSPTVHNTLGRAIVPVYTWMAATEKLGDKLPLKGDDAPLVGDDFVTLNYWRNTPDGRLLFGSLADTYPCPAWLASWRLRRSLALVYPELSNVKFEYLWGGSLAFATNAVPLIGRDTRGLWYATGFGGHGIVPTAMAGELVAAAITEENEDWKLFDDNFKPSYNYWPFSRLGGTLVIQTFNALDALRINGFWVPDVPRPW
eukprot:TRINITY_DN11018_c0_g1_i1.p1 TRINITY_DN11018_c0_g1~~TRINITY_DN11018_c0_g1_i1.p1  ORF type:complete len:458 (+),score=107.73 TRINITY_DN11018_c0_g1_i1:88-1461(+)